MSVSVTVFESVHCPACTHFAQVKLGVRFYSNRTECVLWFFASAFSGNCLTYLPCECAMAQLQSELKSGSSSRSAFSVEGSYAAKTQSELEPGDGSGSDASEQVLDYAGKTELETELKSWNASSMKELNAAETEREYKFSNPPDWKCIICEEAINRNPVYQILR